MARHKKIEVSIPDWARTTDNPCLRSVAEDAYYAKALAVDVGADKRASCVQLVRAAEKSMKVLENTKAKIDLRCAAGDRAARKYWEAKVCARAAKPAR